MYISGCGSKFASKMDGFSGPKEDNLKVFPFLVAMPIGPFSLKELQHTETWIWMILCQHGPNKSSTLIGCSILKKSSYWGTPHCGKPLYPHVFLWSLKTVPIAFRSGVPTCEAMGQIGGTVECADPEGSQIWPTKIGEATSCPKNGGQTYSYGSIITIFWGINIHFAAILGYRGTRFLTIFIGLV